MAQQRLEEIKKIRLDKTEKLRSLGVNPYPSRLEFKNSPIVEALKKEKHETAVAGRVMSTRGHGAILFMDIRDDSGQIQAFFQKDNLEKDFDVVKLIDVGDFVLVRGKVIKTSAGETTVDVSAFQFLAKALRPLPSEWFGLKDEELRYRLRYVDLILNEDARALLKKRAVFWGSIRNFLVKHGFLEVETPVLENTAGGADASPFVTHHDALDIDLYLRISMGELWQKRLMVAGFEKTFEIGRQFRNEGVSREHLQDYTQMEFYWAYANYEDSMKLVEEMYKHIAKETFDKLKFTIGKFEVDLNSRWEKIEYSRIILEKTGINTEDATEDDLKNKLSELKISYSKSDKKGRLIDLLWKSIRKNVAGPAFLVGHPVDVSPLAKRRSGDPALTERFQVIIAGSEMGNGYSELNDPVDQAERFKKQQQMRDEGDAEAQMHDTDFVRALEYGMPPVTGFGVSERLFSFLADKPIRETVFFPLLKPEEQAHE